MIKYNLYSIIHMKNKKHLLNIIPYNNVEFKFVTKHYDIHLKGTCIYDGKLCEFNSIYPDWNEENDCFEETFTEIYELNLFQKIKWLWTQFKFEMFVGYHYSYKKGKKVCNNGFYIRKPKWLYKRLLNMYFGAKIE